MVHARIFTRLTLIVGSLLLAATGSLAQIPSKQTCPRVDIIQLSDQFAAINLDGYTIGHLRTPEIADQFLPKRPNARVIAIKPSIDPDPIAPVDPRPQLSPHCPNVVVRTDDNTLTLGDDLIAKFKNFTPTQDILERVRARQQFVVGHRIQFGFPKNGEMIAKVKSGPDVPMPDAGGGGGDRPIPRDLPKPRSPKNTP